MFSSREAEMEGGIVFATKKLHADWAAFLTDFWALKAGFPGLLEKQGMNIYSHI